MKKFGITAALLMLGATLSLSALAQTAPPEKPGKPGKPGAAGRPGREGRGMMGGRRMQQMMADLNLTEAQKAKIKTLTEASTKKRTALMENKTLTEEQKRTKMREMGKELRDGMDKILTPEQKKKLEEKRKEMRGRFGAPGGPGGGFGRPGGAGRPGGPPPAPSKP